MILNYLKIKGFKFDNIKQQESIKQLMKSKNVETTLINMILEKEFKGNLNLIQKQKKIQILLKGCETLQVYRNQRSNLQNRINAIKKSKQDIISQLKKKIDNLIERWPMILNDTNILKSNYQKVLQFSNEDNFKCSLSKLNQYLKMEKNLTSRLIDFIQKQPKQIKGLNVTYLHSLIQKKKLQAILQKINIKKVQSQIQFLQDNVLVGNTLVYTAKLKKQQQKSQNIGLLLQELQRLIKLDLQCQLPSLTNIQQLVKKQYERQKIIFELLNKETKQINEQVQVFNQIEINQYVNEQEFEKKQNKELVMNSKIEWSVPLENKNFKMNKNLKKILQQNKPNKIKQLGTQIENLIEKIKKIQISANKSK